jgi:aminopeptidase N
MAERANDTAAKLLKDANEKLGALQKENADLKHLNASLQSAVNLSQKLAKDDAAAIARLEKENAQLKSLVPAKQAKLPDAVLHAEPVEYGGKKYRFVLPKVFVPGHGLRTSLEIAAEPEQTALATLIEMESGAIKEVE